MDELLKLEFTKLKGQHAEIQEGLERLETLRVDLLEVRDAQTDQRRMLERNANGTDQIAACLATLKEMPGALDALGETLGFVLSTVTEMEVRLSQAERSMRPWWQRLVGRRQEKPKPSQPLFAATAAGAPLPSVSVKAVGDAAEQAKSAFRQPATASVPPSAPSKAKADPQPDPTFTLRELSEALGISVASLQKRIQQGKLKSVRPEGASPYTPHRVPLSSVRVAVADGALNLPEGASLDALVELAEGRSA